MVPLLFVSRQFVSLLLVFNNSSPLLFVSTAIRLHYYSSPLQFVSTTFCLHYYSSPHNSSPYYSSPTIRLHYYSSPLLFVSRQFVSLRFVSTTIRLHTIRLHTIRLLTICLQQFVSTTIRLHYFSSLDNSSPYDSCPLLFACVRYFLKSSSQSCGRLLWMTPKLNSCTKYYSSSDRDRRQTTDK